MSRAPLAILVVTALSAACPIVTPAEGEGEGEGVGEGEGEGEGDPPVPDGDPQRQSCTNGFGDAVSFDFGRFDGILRAVVPTSQSGCRGDNDHLHLQIEANGETVDVAVNLDAGITVVDHAPVEGFDEGWHPNITFDYVRDLATHAAAFDDLSQGATQSRIVSELADANHVQLYARGYATDGLHDVHRNGAQHDGAIVTKPTEGTAHYILFRFSDQAF